MIIASNGMATLLKIEDDVWMLSWYKDTNRLMLIQSLIATAVVNGISVR
jgi:hypothetical protein